MLSLYSAAPVTAATERSAGHDVMGTELEIRRHRAFAGGKQHVERPRISSEIRVRHRLPSLAPFPDLVGSLRGTA